MNISILILTIQVAIVATAINLPIALAISWLITRKQIKGRLVLDVLVSLPLAIPPVAIGYFLLLLLGRNGPLGSILYNLAGIDLVFTWIAAAIASSIVSFPLIARTIMVAVASVDRRLEMSARSLGASPWRVFITITLPLAHRGILAGILLGFVRAMSEFGATVVVAGNIKDKTQTIPIALFTNVQIGNDEAALQLVGASILLAVVTLIIHNWLLDKSRQKGI